MRLHNTLQCGFIKTGSVVRVTCTNTCSARELYNPVMKYIACLTIENNFGYVYDRTRLIVPAYKPNFDKIRCKVNLFDADGVLIKNPLQEERNLRRARVAVVDYALSNHFQYFGTITLNSEWHDVTNVSECLSKVLSSFNSYQKRYNKDFQYIIVGEFGKKNGRLHFHFLINNINKEDLFINEKGWLDWHYTTDRFGHTQITRIGKTRADHEHVALYCSKYITKQNMRISSHRYFASKTLKKPEITREYDPMFTAFVADWIQENCFAPYVDNRMCTCFSVPLRVYTDLMQAVEEWRQQQIIDENRRVLLFRVPDSVRNPFEVEQLSCL